MARLVDWDLSDFAIQCSFLPITPLHCVNYIHPLGLSNTNHRTDVYVKLLHSLILQNGVQELAGAGALLSLLEQVHGNLEGIVGAGSAAHALAEAIEMARGYSDLQEGLKIALSKLKLTASDLTYWSKALHASRNYSGIAKQLAPAALSAVGVLIQVAETGALIVGDALASITFAIQFQQHGIQVLESLNNHLFAGFAGDPAFRAAFEIVEEELSPRVTQDFYALLRDKMIELSLQHAGEYYLNYVQISLGAASVACLMTGVGAPVTTILGAINLGN